MEEIKAIELSSKDLEDRKRFFVVGNVASPHALKGEVKVFPLTDYPDRFTVGLVLYLDTQRGSVLKLEVERSRVAGRVVVVKFKGLDKIEDVERYKGRSLYIDRKDAVPLEEGEHYVADLIGLDIKEEDGKLLGKLTDVISTGANDVYEMKREDNGQFAYLPVIPDCVLDIDIENNTVTVHVMDGLL